VIKSLPRSLTRKTLQTNFFLPREPKSRKGRYIRLTINRESLKQLIFFILYIYILFICIAMLTYLILLFIFSYLIQIKLPEPEFLNNIPPDDAALYKKAKVLMFKLLKDLERRITDMKPFWFTKMR
jgi:hypothetical protein